MEKKYIGCFIADSSGANYTECNMKIENLNLREGLTSSLHTLIDQSEDIFLSFANEYPKLLKEAESSMNAAKFVLNCFQDYTQDGCIDTEKIEGSDNLAAALAESEQIIRETITFLIGMGKSDSRLFGELEQGIQKLNGLDEKIADIKEDSTEMELISLNAMTVALKAGTSGRAFSYITEELKRLSVRIIDLTDGVTANGKIITSRFSDLQSTMKKLQDFQSEIFDEVNSTLLETFQTLTTALGKTIESLSELNNEAQEVKKPLAKIMEQTQTQDIIRQSLEHVIISIDELQQIEDLPTTEALLDELTFFTLMPQLCIAVLEEVEEQVRTSKDSIHGHINQAEKIISKLDTDRDRVVNVFLDGGNPTNLDNLHKNTTQAIMGMTWKLQEIIARKHTLGNFTLALLKEIQGLHASFNQFATLITRFKTIDIASRIEIAKNTVLGQMSSTVEEMTSLTQRISHHVDTSFTLTSDFLNSSKDTIFQVRDQFETEETMVRKQEIRLNKKFKDLETGKDSLSQMIRNFSVFSTGFISLFKRSNTKFSQLSDLISQITQIRKQLLIIQNEAETARDEVLRKEGMDNWTLQNQKLQLIIKRFTIFSHKKVAGTLAGFEVEDGTPSGEVTLF